MLSLDAPIDEENDGTLHDVIGTHGEQFDAAELTKQRALIAAAAAKTKHAPEIMKALLSGGTLEEAGERVGLSRERARQIETEVIERATKLVWKHAIRRAA